MVHKISPEDRLCTAANLPRLRGRSPQIAAGIVCFDMHTSQAIAFLWTLELDPKVVAFRAWACEIFALQALSANAAMLPA